VPADQGDDDTPTLRSGRYSSEELARMRPGATAVAMDVDFSASLNTIRCGLSGWHDEESGLARASFSVVRLT